jgi:hypothetical protein
VSGTPHDDGRVLMPLAIVKPDKPIGDMTDEELDALADRLFDGIAVARHPA